MLEILNLDKFYHDYNEFHALKDINLNLVPGEMVAILGESGSGKSTLLNVLSGLDVYDSGDIVINGQSTKEFYKKDWATYRNNYVGFIFQEYNLIDHLTLVENVELPLLLQGVSNKEARERAIEKCQLLGLKSHMSKVPSKLSGGQQQRAAIARSLVTEPLVLLADEPTGALDSENSEIILNILKKLAKDHIVILVTHEEEYAQSFADRIITLEDGRVIKDERTSIPGDSTLEAIQLKRPKMKFKIMRKFALNNLKKRKFRTFMTSLTMSFGLIAIFLITFLIHGIRTEVTDFIDEFIPENQYLVRSEKKMVSLDDEMLESVRSINEVDEAYFSYRVRPLVHENPLTRGEYTVYLVDSYNLVGIPEKKSNYMGSKQLVGRYPENANEIIITSSLAASDLFLGLGNISEDNLERSLNEIKSSGMKLTVDRVSHEVDHVIDEEFTVVGIIPSRSFEAYVYYSKLETYEDDITDVDKILVDELYYASKTFNVDRSSIQVYMSDYRDRTLNALEKELGDLELILDNPTEIVYGSIDKFFNTVLYILVGTAAISLLVSGILVGLIVYISVIERIKEIGILTALGARAGNIRSLFIFESGFIGFLSALIGLGISILISMMINNIFRRTIGAVLSSLGITVFEDFNLMKINYLIILIVFVFSVLFAVLSGLIPAFKASKLHAVEALRKE